MSKRTLMSLFVSLLLLLALAACGTAADIQTASSASTAGSLVSAQTAGTAVTTATTAQTTQAAVHTVAEAAAENSAVHEATATPVADAAIVEIVLQGDAITVSGAGASAAGSRVTITAGGVYRLRGVLNDGQVVVDAGEDTAVQLILDGVDLTSTTGAPLVVASAAETTVVLADDSVNHVSDAVAYVFPDAETNEPNAALFSADDLTITGGGALTVDAHDNDGIASKDGLVIAGGTITVNAADDGIRGKDYLVVQGGSLSVTAQGDGLKSDAADDATKGYVLIADGVVNVTAGGDAITAETDVMIADGTFTLTAGGGSSARIDAATSAKGIKGGVSVIVDGGSFAIDAADDAVHANDRIVVNDGTFVIATGDDGMHADATLEINGGGIDITTSYEGVESAVITINGGKITIVASDDGLNVAGGDGSGTAMAMPGAGGRPARGGGPGQDAFAASGDYFLYVNGGYIAVTAAGDGIDVNGSIVMTDGVVLVNGPTENMNGALDCDGSFTISGGLLVGVGSAGMAEAPDTTSSQNSLLLNLSAPLQAGTLVQIAAADGANVLTFLPTKVYQSIAFSSPALVSGATYTVSFGGSASGTATDGLYTDGAVTGGSAYGSFTLSGVVTRLGTTMR